MTPDYETYQSPFSWRYGSQEMRQVWSEVNKRLLWRKLWVTLAEVQAEFGLLLPDQVADLRAHMLMVDVARALEIEAEIHHDLMAELKTFAEQCPLGGGGLHLGATSTDIEDNADVLRQRQSLDMVLAELRGLLQLFAEGIERWAELPLIGFTHLQPAEPSTLGYRLAGYAQDLLIDWQSLHSTRAELRGKGFTGAVGTKASFAELIGAENLPAFDNRLSQSLDLLFFPVTTQVYPRKQDYILLSHLAGLGASLYKFAFDLRLLQSSPIGELNEPFGKGQVGSSAMPFKRNPINAEKIDSLARLLAQMPRTAWDNAANSLLERTLDDSANRRNLLPEAFLVTDELLRTAKRILDGLQVNEPAIKRNLEAYAPFAAVERVLMALGKVGANRQGMHETLRKHSLGAWSAIQSGEPNPLADSICNDPEISHYLSMEGLRQLMDITHYLGDAPKRARQMADTIRKTLAN
ncbi:MAG: adenylosuccinate lyase [Chloroflexi bacterium RBG_16_54_11]|nr:MAG: adenylosuccinate lyase [Chloroflexi bacterium RBG_16_54_11]